MSGEAAASRQIDQTLRLERDAAERQIALFRLLFFTMVFITGPIFMMVGRLMGTGAPSPVPSLVLFGGCIAYSALLLWDARRAGARTWLPYLAVALDLLAILSPGLIFPRFDPIIARDTPIFAAHLAGPGALMVLAVNSLRMRVDTAIYGSVLSAPLVLAVLLHAEGMKPPIVGVLSALVFTGLLGVAAARRSRHSLLTFARMQLLQRYLPPAAVQRVLEDDPDSALALGGRLTTVTLIAADLRGFTRMSEKLPPDEVVQQLNAFHGRMLEQIEQHGGALDKFIGDGILAVFGMQGDATDAGAANAVACAQGMLASLEAHNAERAASGLSALAMGIGVHTGPVVAGNIGAPGRRLEFTVIGDTVNTTARLEGLTKEAGRPLLVSRATVERLGGAAPLEALPPMAVRGRDEPLEVYGPRAPLPASGGTT